MFVLTPFGYTAALSEANKRIYLFHVSKPSTNLSVEINFVLSLLYSFPLSGHLRSKAAGPSADVSHCNYFDTVMSVH
jgi:hypothetical protein